MRAKEQDEGSELIGIESLESMNLTFEGTKVEFGTVTMN